MQSRKVKQIEANTAEYIKKPDSERRSGCLGEGKNELYMRTKKLISILTLITIVFMQLAVPSEAKSVSQIQSMVPREAMEYAKSHFRDYTADYYVGCGGKRRECQDLELGKPFIILKSDGFEQDEIYYYPISENGIIVRVMGIIGSDEGWSASFTEEWVDQIEGLNKKGLLADVFYDVKGHLNPIASENVTSVNGTITVDNNKGVIQKHLLKKINTLTIDRQPTIQLDEYARKLSTNTDSSKICQLYYQVKQGKYPCWAAAVATIVNYYMGSKYSAKNVCDEMNRYEGDEIGFSQLALSRYAISFNNLMTAPKIMSWNEIKSNISGKSPIYVSSRNSLGEGHALVAYGYSIAAGNKYVTFWNPHGMSVSSEFKTSGTKILVGEDAFIWRHSLSEH